MARSARNSERSNSRSSKSKSAGFCVLGLGKLGGAEVGYGSDLDVLFVAPSGTKNLPACQNLAAGVMDLLARPTELGIVFRIDTRLRPDGEKGLLVNKVVIPRPRPELLNEMI